MVQSNVRVSEKLLNLSGIFQENLIEKLWRNFFKKFLFKKEIPS